MLKFEDALREAGLIILEKIGSRSSNYFASGYESGRVTDRTGRLLDSIMGGAGSIREIKFSGDRATFTIGSKVPYAALQEKGGVRIVTEKMKRFFWHKYFEAKIVGSPLLNMWSALRFKNIIRYPARPYLEPAVRDVAIEIPEILKRYTMQYLEMTIKESITGTPRAVPLNAIK